MNFDVAKLKKKELLRIEAAAFWLDCSRSTIYELIETGKLERFKDGNRSRITRDSVVQYINSHLVDPII